MAEKQTQTITIDDVSYTEDQLTEQQKGYDKPHCRFGSKDQVNAV
jgi:hypothetical protein